MKTRRSTCAILTVPGIRFHESPIQVQTQPRRAACFTATDRVARCTLLHAVLVARAETRPLDALVRYLSWWWTDSVYGSRGSRDHGGGAVRHAVSAVVRADHLLDVACDNMLGRGVRTCCADRHGFAPWRAGL